MLFEIEPLRGVGPLRLGSTPDEAYEALGTLGLPPLWMCLGGHYSVVRDSGLGISPRTRTGELEAVYLEGPPESGSGDTVTYRRIDLFAAPYQQVVDALRKHTTVVEDDHAFIAPELELMLTLSWDDPDPDTFERVILSLPDPG